jgi:tRNA(fMet)-specific endonuclease VapC
LDAGICACILKRSNAALMKRLARTEVKDVAVSAITVSELMFAVMTSAEPEQDQAALELFLRHVTVLEYSGEAGRDYGAIREALELRGDVLGAHEMLLAAQARSLGMALVTDRVKEFGRVPELRVERWSR